MFVLHNTYDIIRTVCMYINILCAKNIIRSKCTTSTYYVICVARDCINYKIVHNRIIINMLILGGKIVVRL
jgi:hypothetical protein